MSQAKLAEIIILKWTKQNQNCFDQLRNRPSICWKIITMIPEHLNVKILKNVYI